ncbi:MAG: hypothetical protein IPI46_08165 [Bacteroidetes bacterium]|nr:hypothetical protein [Bacteroidota bacterium]
MKSLYLLIVVMLAFQVESLAQTNYNPYVTAISFSPTPTTSGFECGSTTLASFNLGISTPANSTQLSNPLTVTICVTGFQFQSTNPTLVVSGTYASHFSWDFDSFAPNCLIGTQTQILNGSSFGSIQVSIQTPTTLTVGSNLGVVVNLQIPGYMQQGNSGADDYKISPPAVTYCGCSPITNAGTITGNQNFCGSGNPVAFTATLPTGGSGTILYQWQNSTMPGIWTDITGATSSTYDAPLLTTTQSYRRKTKRNTCTYWINSNIITVSINIAPTANAGLDKSLSCIIPNSIIGTPAVSGNSYSWSPSTGLSASNIAEPLATSTTTTTYTVTVTNVGGCTSTDAVIVTVDKTPPVANAGVDRNLTCANPTAIIGTAGVAGNTYSWSPAIALSSSNIAQPIANPTASTVYTVTVTGANGCTSTDAVIVNAIVGSCSTNLTLKLYIEGYYLFSGEMASVLFNQGVSTNVSHADSIHVQLRSTTPPYNVVASTHTILTTTGNATCVFPPSVSGNYYVVIKHRNAIETWSSNGVTVGAIPAVYDFSNAISKAYGDNMVLVSSLPIRYAFFSGDLNYDENIDVLDLSIIENDINNFLFGYEKSDLNGDGNVDILDNSLIEVNLNNFIYSNHP